jgi:hypothetical protein
MRIENLFGEEVRHIRRHAGRRGRFHRKYIRSFFGDNVQQVGATSSLFPSDMESSGPAYTVPMDTTADVSNLPDEPSLLERIASAPGNLVAANLKPIEKEVAATVANVGQSASATVKGVTGPLIPILIIGVVGAYFYFTSKKVSVNVNRAMGW